MISVLCLMGIKNQAEGFVPAPKNVLTEIYQREIVLKWNSSETDRVQWEVVVNDGPPLIAEENKFIVEGLEPNTNYHIKIRAVKNDEYSAYVTVDGIRTKPLERGVDDIRRIPYLRTLATQPYMYGSIPQTIGLFYNELAVKDAKITYRVDGKVLKPDGSYLTFPKKGRQKLTVVIEETTDRIWELIYNLNVTNL